MCGIAGLIRPTGLLPGDEAAAARLAARLAHRGPDGAGVYADSHAALAATRLALLDPRPHPLPMTSPDGRFVLVFNGQIYNHAELRAELAAHWEFRTATDTEVLLALLLRRGANALPRLRGMFAFLLWDARDRRALAAVDPLSVKPLLYHASSRLFAFSSEAAPLYESGLLPFAPRAEAIAEHLSAPYFSAARELPFANLERLMPGHALLWEDGHLHRHHYAAAAPAPAPLLPLLAAAVRQAAAADAPVGLFLSGGLDSSLLAALAPGPLPSFTISYPHTAADYASSLIVRSDDLPFAAAAARHFGHPHHIVAPADFPAALRRTVYANDLIAAWEQEVSQNLLAEAAARHVKAVLVGDAADETHYGYSFLLDPARVASPRRLLEFFGTVPLRPSLLADPAGHFTESYRALAASRGHSWETPGSARLAASVLIRELWLTRLLHNGDLHLMAHGVEGRVPFADPPLLAAAAAVPAGVALAGGIEKHHLRTAAAAVLPAELAWRPKSALTKHLGARALIHAELAAAWAAYQDLLAPYVEPGYVTNLLAAGPPATDRETGLCFRLLASLTWFGRFAGGAPA